tara:strand:+ start:4185 stop:4499 length:315 start_codon:yes stop_codon:yes gene_type:complete
MGRYTKCKNIAKRIENGTGKVIPRQKTIPILPESIDIKRADDFYVIAQDGDRLDLLSHRFYGDVSYWYIIAAANGMGKGSYYVTPGVQIRIPARPGDIEEDIKG